MLCLSRAGAAISSPLVRSSAIVFMWTVDNSGRGTVEESASSRMTQIAVRDATDAEGIAYLRKLLLESEPSLHADVKKAREEMIPRLVAEVTNGRPLALVMAAKAVKMGMPFEGACVTLSVLCKAAALTCVVLLCVYRDPQPRDAGRPGTACEGAS